MLLLSRFLLALKLVSFDADCAHGVDHEKAEGTTYRQNTQADEYENELISVDHEALPEASYQTRNGQENSATVQQNKRNTEQAELIDFPRKNRL